MISEPQRHTREPVKGSGRKVLITFLWLGTFCLSVVIGLYFRTYPLHGTLPWVKTRARQHAEQLVTKTIRQQLFQTIEAQVPDMPLTMKNQLVAQRLQEIINSDQANYERAVQDAANALLANRYPSTSRHYLTGADSYYYYYFTKQIRDEGRLGEPFREPGYFVHPLRLASLREAITWHPYVGYALYRVLNLLEPGIALMDALCFVPLVLTILTAAAFFLLCRVLSVDLLATFLGSLTLLLAPILIQRSHFGWYDTDPYNSLFPFAILGTYFAGVNTTGYRRWGLVGTAGFLTGLYGLFWTGWPLIVVLVGGGGIVGGTFLYYQTQRTNPSYWVCTFIYLVTAFLFLCLFIHPLVLWRSILGGLRALSLFQARPQQLWPTAFLTVGETKATSLHKLVFLTGNYVTAGMAIGGGVFTALRALLTADVSQRARSIFLATFALPLFMLSLRAERFSLLLVIAVALYVAFFVQELFLFTEELMQRRKLGRWLRYWIKIGTGVLLLLLFLPYGFISAHVAALERHLIMNDTWYESLVTVREHTPQDAIILSWWPPGHFITSIAERRVFVDGASQHMVQTFWIAKALLAIDEREALGLIRMLALSGEAATDFLQEMGYKPAFINEIFHQILPLSRQEAFKVLPAGMPARERNKLLDLTHGNPLRRSLPPVYVFLYNDLIEQNLALTLMAYWDFERAQKILDERKGLENKSLPSSFPPQLEALVGPVKGILKYQPEAPLVQRQGNILVFGNGLHLNTATYDAWVNLPEKGISGRPFSLLYLENDILKEKNFEGDLFDVSALLIPKGNSYSCVLADRRLLHSILFRLYYLDGQGLRHFEPFYTKESPKTATRIKIYKVKWDTFTAPKQTTHATA